MFCVIQHQRDQLCRTIRGTSLPKRHESANLPVFSSMQSAMTNIPTAPKLPGKEALLPPLLRTFGTGAHCFRPDSVGMNNRDAQFQNTHESHSKVGAPDGAKMPLSILTESLVKYVSHEAELPCSCSITHANRCSAYCFSKKQREAEHQRSQAVSNTNRARWPGKHVAQ